MQVMDHNWPPGRTKRRLAKEFKADAAASVLDGTGEIHGVAVEGLDCNDIIGAFLLLDTDTLQTSVCASPVSRCRTDAETDIYYHALALPTANETDSCKSQQ